MQATWSEPESVPPLPDGRTVITDVSPNMLIEGPEIYFLFMVDDTTNEWGSCTVLRRYNHEEHSWGEPSVFGDEEWRGFALTSEASLVRAANGNLVASFRSGRKGPSNLPADKWRGIVTATSADNGVSWSWPKVHSLYAHVHSSLCRLPDGRLLLTYAARVGEIDGVLYHGHECVVSHTHGETWDWEHRFVVFRGVDGAQVRPRPRASFLSASRA